MTACMHACMKTCAGDQTNLDPWWLTVGVKTEFCGA